MRRLAFSGYRKPVIEERMPPGTVERMHRHARAQQFFYILSGEAIMIYGEGRVVLKSGDGLGIRAGVPHQIRNDGGEDLRFLVTSDPSTKNDREELE